jgi:hypothetical protein
VRELEAVRAELADYILQWAAEETLVLAEKVDWFETAVLERFGKSGKVASGKQLLPGVEFDSILSFFLGAGFLLFMATACTTGVATAAVAGEMEDDVVVRGDDRSACAAQYPEIVVRTVCVMSA